MALQNNLEALEFVSNIISAPTPGNVKCLSAEAADISRT
jgi:hypothetical protein